MEQSGASSVVQNSTERGHHRYIQEPCQKRKLKCIENIIVESEKSSVEQSGASSVVQNNSELGEYPIGEGRKTTAAKYTKRWKIM